MKLVIDSLDHDLLREVIRQRVKDGSILRLIGKWLKETVNERVSDSKSYEMG